MAQTKLWILIDESIPEPLATYIADFVPSAVRSKLSVGVGAKDPAIVRFANNERRTIVALDSDFRKHRFSTDSFASLAQIVLMMPVCLQSFERF